MTDHVQVVVVGAGLTGLALGHHLAAAGVSHRILEATPRVGGVIRSRRVEGHLLELGPQRTRLTVEIRSLIDALDLGDDVITAPTGLPLFVYRAGRLRRVPFSASEFLRSDIVPLTAKLRLAGEPFTAAARPDERVADYFIRKVGRPLYENLLGPLYGGLYASDPKDMVVRLSLGRVLEEFGIRRSLILPLLRRGGSVSPPPAVSFREGMETLPRRLAERSKSAVVLDAGVEQLTSTQNGWHIRHAAGELQADHVVLTPPAPAAAAILDHAAPRLAAALRRLTYNPLAVVHLHAETDLLGLGYQVSFAEPLATRGVTFNDSLFQRHGVYTVYLGGAKNPDVVGWTDGRLGEVAVREFREVTGFEARVLQVEREWMPAWDHSWSALDRVDLPPRLALAANWESRPGIPGRLAQAKRLAARLATDLADP